jgi:hypothetical protein
MKASTVEMLVNIEIRSSSNTDLLKDITSAVRSLYGNEFGTRLMPGPSISLSFLSLSSIV